jgi:hypothetical protein
LASVSQGDIQYIYATVLERNERYTHITNCCNHSDKGFSGHCGLHGSLQLTLASQGWKTRQDVVYALATVVRGWPHHRQVKLLFYCCQGASASSCKAATAAR